MKSSLRQIDYLIRNGESRQAAVLLTQTLVAFNSVTPDQSQALEMVAELLCIYGFETHIIRKNGIKNLFSRWGAHDAKTILGFNGHTDVVPVVDKAKWTHPPFSGIINEDTLWGRGACDMKSGVAAYIIGALTHSIKASTVQQKDDSKAALVLTLTGDEEGDAFYGTKAILDWMLTHNETMHACLVGEPTSQQVIGDTVKIGRRGSMRVQFTCQGRSGHSAYPELAVNPIPPLCQLVDKLSRIKLDQGSDAFQPSTLAFSQFIVANSASNVIPGSATAVANIRFNDCHSFESLKAMLDKEVNALCQVNPSIRMGTDYHCSGESFSTDSPDLFQAIKTAIESVVGCTPKKSTGGGTSDARFIKDFCPVIEFGLVGDSMHQDNEKASVSDIGLLTEIYIHFINHFFSSRIP